MTRVAHMALGAVRCCKHASNVIWPIA